MAANVFLKALRTDREAQAATVPSILENWQGDNSSQFFLNFENWQGNRAYTVASSLENWQGGVAATFPSILEI